MANWELIWYCPCCESDGRVLAQAAVEIIQEQGYTIVPVDGVKSFGKDPYLNEMDIHFDSKENMIAFFNAMQRYFDPSASVSDTPKETDK